MIMARVKAQNAITTFIWLIHMDENLFANIEKIILDVEKAKFAPMASA